jgi:hypothetical protein
VSVPVDLDELNAHIARFGASALLVTAASEGPPRVTSVLVTLDAPHLAVRVGTRTRANANEHPDVTFVWPVTDGRHCLIVDGAAEPGDGEALLVMPVSAVLHRLAQVD